MLLPIRESVESPLKNKGIHFSKKQQAVLKPRCSGGGEKGKERRMVKGKPRSVPSLLSRNGAERTHPSTRPAARGCQPQQEQQQ